MPRRAIFVDRDGTLPVADAGTPRLLAGAAAAIRRINRANRQAVIVTHRPEVAFGLLDEDALAELHEGLRLELLEKAARIDGIYHCPHHPEGVVERYRKECACRKPGVGLLERARDEMGIDLRGSFLVGDRAADLRAAAACGMPALLVRSGRGAETEAALAELRLTPAAVVDTIADAVDWILREAGVEAPAR